MTEFLFSQGYTFVHFFIVLLISFGVTTFFYWRTFSTLSRRRFFTLLVLRFLTITTVVFLLFRPMLQYTQEKTIKKSIIFAVDTSASMGISDGAGTTGSEDAETGIVMQVQVRLDQVKDKIRTWSEKLSNDFKLHLVSFADRLDNFGSTNAAPTLKATGNSTSLSYGLEGGTSVSDGGKKVNKTDIEALFLFSDGQHNTASKPKPEEKAQKLGIPVFAIGVGTGLKSSSSFKDVQVSEIRVPDRMTVNNKARITVGVDAVGLEGRTVKVILEEDTSLGTEPARSKNRSNTEKAADSTAVGASSDETIKKDTASVEKDITIASGNPQTANRRTIGELELLLDAIEGTQEVVFEIKPEKVGRTLYIGRVEPLSDEAIRENNERQTASLVVEPGMRVCYFEGTLRPEYGAIVERFLSKDPDLEFCAMIQTKSGVFQRRSNMEDMKMTGLPTDQGTIDMFDVFIFGDIDSSFFPPAVQEMIVNRVKAGAGLAMLGGYHSLGPGGYAGTPIGSILPVILGDREVGQFSEPFMPKLTPDGTASHIFANIGDFFPSSLGVAKKEGLPPLSGCTRVIAAQPGATILATCPDVTVPGAGGTEVEMPVIATMPVGDGRSVVFTGDTTRKWEQGPRAMNQETPFMQFWGQFIRFLAGREGPVLREASVSASVDKAYYEPQESITISATVKNADGIGDEKSTVTATLTRPDGKKDEVTLDQIAGTPGKYLGVIEPKTIGQHEMEVSAKSDGLKINAPEKMILDVGRPNMEFDRLDLNEELMTKLADISGGRYAHITTADFLIDQLNRDQLKRKDVKQVRLAPPLAFWAIFVVLLTIEWTLRRKYHLR
ncbi:MAG: hypothetical protein ACRCUY_03695 [Thermoguttaceae bacterium]